MKGIRAELLHPVLAEKQQQVYIFNRLHDGWYVEIPEEAQGPLNTKTEFLPGATDVLDLIANHRQRIALKIDTVPFDKADVMVRVGECIAQKGGCYYFLETCKGRKVNQKIWVRDMLLLIFGDMPDAIYIRQVPFPSHK